MKLWDVALEAEKGGFSAPGRVYSVSFSFDGRKLATGGSSGGFRVGVVWEGKAPAPPEPKPLNLWDVPQGPEATDVQGESASAQPPSEHSVTVPQSSPPTASSEGGKAILEGDETVTVKWIVNPANGHEYCLTPVLSWPDAQAAAERLGGNLATVNDAAENSWLASTFGSCYWIGLNDVAVEGNFVWASGEPASYKNWAPGEPNNGDSTGEQDWVIINYAQPGQWDDQYSNGRHHGIVERVKPNNP